MSSPVKMRIELQGTSWKGLEIEKLVSRNSRTKASPHPVLENCTSDPKDLPELLRILSSPVIIHFEFQGTSWKGLEKNVDFKVVQEQCELRPVLEIYISKFKGLPEPLQMKSGQLLLRPTSNFMKLPGRALKKMLSSRYSRNNANPHSVLEKIYFKIFKFQGIPGHVRILSCSGFVDVVCVHTKSIPQANALEERKCF